MSIPITCGGCGAAFDVPDNLAGKTIRCTSCKAQMAVTEPEAVAVAELAEAEPVAVGQSTAKKPFGSGSQTAPKSAPPKPSPAPAKTEAVADAKTAPAKPASKAAVAVEVDEEEKSEKTKPAKSGSGEKKAATAKKRRDDDDDDDDDDEKPTRRKNKNQSGGSGAMIGIIAAGAIGLAAIAGISIWLLSGDSDDKKTDTAKNDTTPPPSAGPTPGGPPPGPGGIVPPGPGGGRPPGGGGKPPGPGGMLPGPGGPSPTPGASGPVPGDVEPGPMPGMPPGPGGVVQPPNPTPGMPPGPGGVGEPPVTQEPMPGFPPMPGGGIGQPPMPGGGIGQPPGGGIGGGQVNTDGNMKARLDPFFTAAFDTEKNEVYTLEPRTLAANRYAGTLHRYGANFQSLNKFKIAQVGFRTAIDAKAGLLYVAYATNAAGLFTQHLDRASAVGNIAVYDLKPIRDGKNAEGKVLEEGTEIKPVGTITVGSTIHGMELSDDAKSLYVLVTTGTTKKVSSLIMIDTAKRAEVKEKRNELPELARDLVKARDGKTLIVIEDFTKNKSSGVLLFDTSAWAKVKSMTFRDAASLDVAPQSDGSMIVSVLTVKPMGAPGVGPGGQPGGGPGGQPGGGGIGIGQPGGGGIGIGQPGGGIGIGGQPGGQPGGGQPQVNVTFKLVLIDSTGVEKGEMDLGAAAHVANGGYVEYDQDNKKLFVSSWKASGLDVYEVTEAGAANGVKLKTAIKTARREEIKGHFLMSPDGKYIVFHNGVVIDTSNVGGSLGTSGQPGGQPFPGGMPLPGGQPPGGGIVPGVPGGGVVPPGMPPGGPGKPPIGVGVPPMPGMPPGLPVLTPGTGGPALPIPGGMPPVGPGKPPGGPGKPPIGVGVPPMPGMPPGAGAPPGGPGKPNPAPANPGGNAPGGAPPIVP